MTKEIFTLLLISLLGFVPVNAQTTTKFHSEVAHLVLHNANDTNLVAEVLSPIVIPAVLHNSGGGFVGSVNPNDSAANYGRIKATVDISTGQTITGTLTADESTVTVTHVSGSGSGTGTLYDIALGGDVNQTHHNPAMGNFTFPAGSGKSSLDNLAVGGSLWINGGASSGIYEGMLPMTLTDSTGDSTQLALPINFIYLAPLSIGTQRNMSFPSIDSQPGVFTQILNPMTYGAAIFSASGSNGTTATLTVANVELKRSGTSSPSITVNDFTFGGSASQHGASTGQVTFGSSGYVNNIRVGATAHYPANPPGGTYTGTGMIEITY